MSYLAFDLDALNVVPDVARAAGMTPGDVSYGLLRLWAWCFRERQDVVSPTHVRGFFGTDATPALEAFGFVETTPTGLRVRGAERYLRVAERQSKAGKARAALAGAPAGRVAGRFTSQSPATDQPTTSHPPALTPSTEHRAPNTECLEDIVETRPKAHPLAEVWNAHKAPTQPTWSATSKTRRVHADARLSERSLEQWVEVVKRIAASEFLSGRSGKWTAGPDWLIKSPDNAIRVLEGSYDNNRNPPGRSNGAPVAAESFDWTQQTPGEVAL